MIFTRSGTYTSPMLHQLDHVAILVPNAEQVVQQLTARGLPAKGLTPGEIESFPSEGTRECYLGADGRLGRLLLMEATSNQGPYARALAKRGPGLHHVALTVPDLDLFLNSVTGWLLVPGCVSSLARTKTAWLAGTACTLATVALFAAPQWLWDAALRATHSP